MIGDDYDTPVIGSNDGGDDKDDIDNGDDAKDEIDNSDAKDD